MFAGYYNMELLSPLSNTIQAIKHNTDGHAANVEDHIEMQNFIRNT
jgi:hypothetical protein